MVDCFQLTSHCTMAPCVVRGTVREREASFPGLCWQPAPAQAVVRWCKFLADPGPGPGPANHRALGWAGWAGLGWAGLLGTAPRSPSTSPRRHHWAGLGCAPSGYNWSLQQPSSSTITVTFIVCCFHSRSHTVSTEFANILCHDFPCNSPFISANSMHCKYHVGHKHNIFILFAFCNFPAFTLNNSSFYMRKVHRLACPSHLAIVGWIHLIPEWECSRLT